MAESRRQTGTRRASCVLVGAAAALLLVLILSLAFSPSAFHWPLRLAALLLLVACAARLARGGRLLLVSPLFLLGAVGIVFFSILPALFPHLMSLPDTRIPAQNLAAIRRFSQGQGDLVVLQFSVLCLLCTVVLLAAMPGRCAWSGQPVVPVGMARKAAGIAAALLVLGLLPYGLAAMGLPGSGTSREFLHGAPPVLSVAVGIFFLIAVGRDRSWVLAALTATAVACVGLFSTGMPKMGVFITLSGIGAILTRRAVSRGQLVAGFAGGLLFLTLATPLVAMKVATDAQSKPSTSARILSEFQRKILIRQAVTAGCLQEVIEKRTPDGKGSTPFYFTHSVVPRVFWPEKPSLSRGKEFAIDYCNMNPETYSKEHPHSASVTLLGEPIVERGWRGLVVAELFIVCFLLAGTALALAAGAPGALAMIAMLPWLADFDQIFEMFVGNSAKMFLWMLPFIGLFGWLVRRRIDRSAPASLASTPTNAERRGPGMRT